jgi:aspartate/methionine/tyrosine aminotransferase
VKLPPFALERYFAPREFVARAQLSSSDCESLALDDVLARADDELRALWSRLTLGYAEYRGHPLLRAEIAALYASARVEDTMACAPSEGILLAMTALLEAGDRVVCCAPAYQSLHEIARGAGCTVDEWPFPFDMAQLHSLVRARATRMIVVNFPHNPTGHVPTRDEWRAIVDVAREAGAILFSDEMYRFLDLDPSLPPLPSAVDEYEMAIALGGLSKAFSAPGLRAGWLVSRDVELLDRCAEQKDYTTICGNGPGELLSAMVLRDKARILARNVELIRANVAALESALGVKGPRAGCITFAPMRDATATCDALFRETQMLLLPSSVFGFGDGHVRFGLGRAPFARAVEECAAWLARRA